MASAQPKAPNPQRTLPGAPRRPAPAPMRPAGLPARPGLPGMRPGAKPATKAPIKPATAKQPEEQEVQKENKIEEIQEPQPPVTQNEEPKPADVSANASKFVLEFEDSAIQNTTRDENDSRIEKPKQTDPPSIEASIDEGVSSSRGGISSPK